MAQQSCSYCGGPFNGGNYLSCSIIGARNEFVHDPNSFPYDNTPEFYDQPPQHHVETYSCELCGNDSHYGYDFPPWFSLVYEQEPSYNQNFSDNYYPQNPSTFPKQYLCCENYGGPHESFQCQPMNQNYFEPNPSYNSNYAANLSTHTPEPSRHFNYICYDDDDDDDDDEEKTIPLCDIISQLPLSIAITTSHHVLSIMEPEDSLIMGNKDLNTIPKKESNELIKSSVEDLVPILSESEDTSRSDSECDLPTCDDFSPINVPMGKFVTLSNTLFDSNDDFTSSDDKSLSDEDVPEDNVKIYSNHLFEFDDEYISSDVNPLFDEVLEDIESKAAYDSKLDKTALLVTPLSDANKDECFDPGGDVDEINAFDIPLDFEDGYYDSEGDVLYLESLLSDDATPNLPLEVFLGHDPRSLSDINDLNIMVKIFDPGILENFFSPTYVRLPFEDHNYLSLTYVIRIFLPYFTYLVDSSLPLSSRGEDIIFDPGIFAFSFYFLEPVASHRSGAFMCINVYPNILNESSMEI
uniref:Pre-mRNA splicing Prp18-interacting factor n=1 Tax=Tanacetum cinerariifolium TaxID=118510 RepID=A0A6L2M934_TANCI|nr:hypothetical protein [Tanacetum cinerariifolium]